MPRLSSALALATMMGLSSSQALEPPAHPPSGGKDDNSLSPETVIKFGFDGSVTISVGENIQSILVIGKDERGTPTLSIMVDEAKIKQDFDAKKGNGYKSNYRIDEVSTYLVPCNDVDQWARVQLANVAASSKGSKSLTQNLSAAWNIKQISSVGQGLCKAATEQPQNNKKGDGRNEVHTPRTPAPGVQA
jgi:hypothetical protein